MHSADRLRLKMTSKGLFAAVLLICVWTFSEAQLSCKGRCGRSYYRGHTCQCDFSCLLYGECCQDYEQLCTSKNSCEGRCGERFRRGRGCTCDADCVKYKQCCPDFTDHCNEMEEVEGEPPVKSESCDNNVERKPTDLTPEATAQPLGTQFISEGNDPGDSPTVNLTSYQNDDSDSPSRQTVEMDAPDPSPLPEGSSGFDATTSELLLEDFTSEPPLPDLDGFEVFPEPPTTPASKDNTTEPPTTSATQDQTVEDATTSASRDETTEDATTTAFQDQTTEYPTTSASRDETTEDATITAFQDQTTEDPTTMASQNQTAEDATTSASQNQTTLVSTTVVPSTAEVTTDVMANTDADDFVPEPTLSDLVSDQPTPETTASVTDGQTNQPENPTTAPTSPPWETPETTTTLLPESSESTVSTYSPAITTISPSTTNRETTAMPEMTTTSFSTSAPGEEVTEMSTTAVDDTTTAEEPTNAATSKPEEKPFKPFKPVLDPNIKPVLNGLDDSTDYPADDSNDMDLCSGRPVSGVTTLSNGTIVVFRGHFFWVLDRDRVPGPAQGITQVWGIPSPIDTVFTRCNCRGKTYIFKGPQYWRFENDVLDAGFPKIIQTGFDGLRGHITAALSVPQYNSRRESVYFFKRGGNVQKYSYQFGTNPTCGRKVHYAIYTHRNRVARQAPVPVSLLDPTINYRTSWSGFPTTITAAVSIPNRREPEGYSYYVFSRAKSYKIRIEGERPVLAAATPNASPQRNEVFKCPNKISKSQ